eukprot:CAMPEP_0117464486 /NCGR_PEP_ID=MMETSP0784-20121206/4126_1 /TAXON_ID=39447 /ORGANISM="" /LENGTH=64 /DNA_ID=CAMNT_0005258347 /DNA_START=1398 /DNA_END=1588 /DNA_ORIENTATION=-
MATCKGPWSLCAPSVRRGQCKRPPSSTSSPAEEAAGSSPSAAGSSASGASSHAAPASSPPVSRS